MNTKSIGMLAVVAALAVTGAWIVRRDTGPVSEAKVYGTGEKLFPGLLQRVNDVAKVTLTNKDGSFTLEKSGETWGMADKGGYPINFEKAKELVVRVADMEIVAQKTSKPEFYGELEVQDVTVPDSPSTQATLFDAGGQKLADVILGKTKTNKGFGGEATMYVRKVGEAASWEVTGRLYIEANSSGWLDKQLAKLEKSRVRKVHTAHPDGANFEIVKNVPEDQAFLVPGLPEGAELKWNGVADPVASALEWMNFEDVQAADKADLTGATATETVFTTWDGLVVTAKLSEKDEKAYLQLAARYDESARYSPPAAVGPVVPVEGEDPAASIPPTPPSVGKTPEEVQQEAAELQRKLANWVFEIPTYSAANFKKTVKDMIKEPTPPADPALELDGSTVEGSEDADSIIEMPVVDEHAGHDHAPDEHPVAPPTEPPVETPPGGGN